MISFNLHLNLKLIFSNIELLNLNYQFRFFSKARLCLIEGLKYFIITRV